MEREVRPGYGDRSRHLVAGPHVHRHGHHWGWEHLVPRVVGGVPIAGLAVCARAGLLEVLLPLLLEIRVQHALHWDGHGQESCAKIPISRWRARSVYGPLYVY